MPFRSSIDRLKANLAVTTQEAFESRIQLELNMTRDPFGQFTEKNLKRDDNSEGFITRALKTAETNVGSPRHWRTSWFVMTGQSATLLVILSNSHTGKTEWMVHS